MGGKFQTLKIAFEKQVEFWAQSQAGFQGPKVAAAATFAKKHQKFL